MFQEKMVYYKNLRGDVNWLPQGQCLALHSSEEKMAERRAKQEEQRQVSAAPAPVVRACGSLSAFSLRFPCGRPMSKGAC
jgi:hypothetical protein